MNDASTGLEPRSASSPANVVKSTHPSLATWLVYWPIKHLFYGAGVLGLIASPALACSMIFPNDTGFQIFGVALLYGAGIGGSVGLLAGLIRTAAWGLTRH